MRDQSEADQQHHHQKQHPSSQNAASKMISILAFFFTFLTVTLLVIIYSPFEYSNPTKILDSATQFGYINSANASAGTDTKEETVPENCDLFTGDWIPDPDGPYYTNATCYKMHGYQNCMKHGRADSDYLKWRWKPDRCELPKFDPAQFLELVRGKSMAFVGDSLARNYFQSLGCLLAKVVIPEDVSSPQYPNSQYWEYRDYNFSMYHYDSVFLIKADRPKKDPTKLYLDEFDEYWTSEIKKYDYMIISGGPWYVWTRSRYYENRRLIGCNRCKDQNITDLGYYTAYQKALRTSLRALAELGKPGAVFLVKTISPPHFENGDWFSGGRCARTKPFRRGGTSLQPSSAIMRGMQLEEVRIAQEEGIKKGLKFRVVDVTDAMLLRPDGHPDKYCRAADKKGFSDCLHWCLPGPVDVWNDFLLQLIIRDRDTTTHDNTK